MPQQSWQGVQGAVVEQLRGVERGAVADPIAGTVGVHNQAVMLECLRTYQPPFGDAALKTCLRHRFPYQACQHREFMAADAARQQSAHLFLHWGGQGITAQVEDLARTCGHTGFVGALQQLQSSYQERGVLTFDCELAEGFP